MTVLKQACQVHDHLLASYEVDCVEGRIVFRTKSGHGRNAPPLPERVPLLPARVPTPPRRIPGSRAPQS